jgi:hypothetical protein
MKKFVGQEGLFYALFSENNIKILKKFDNLKYYDIRETKPYIIELEINVNDKIELIQLHISSMPNSALQANPTTRLTDLEFDFYMNPPEDSIVIYDRWIFERYFDFVFKQYGISEFNRLINRYKERNVKVIFNFAFFEPNEYESLNYFLIKYNYGFDCIKITDYELFNGDDNFIFSKTFNVFHIVGDLMSFQVNEMFRDNNVKSIHNLFPIEEISNAEKIYSHLTLKPRPHRMNVINKLYDLDIVDYGYCTLNKLMYDEYEERKNKGFVYSTDNCLMQSKWLYDYFKNIDYRGYEYYSKKLSDTLGKDFWSHLRHYLEHKEYKKSYIDVVGETHILFHTMFSYFSEKSYYPILTEKFFIIYGANRFYEMLEELDCYNSLDLFGLDNSYYKIESPYEQGEIITKKLKELIDKINSGEFDIEEYYKKNKYKLIDTKQKILSKFTDGMVDVKKFIFE